MYTYIKYIYIYYIHRYNYIYIDTYIYIYIFNYIYIYNVYTRTLFIAVCHFPPISVRHPTQVEAKLQRRGQAVPFFVDPWRQSENRLSIRIP